MHRILVVDDDRELRENIGEVLTKSGFEVTLAAHGEEALELLAKGLLPAVVLLDVMMPGLGGMEVLPLIRRAAPGTRVIMITAFATVENAVEAMRRGAEDYLVKPFRVDELTMAVRRCLESARFQECSAMLDAEDTFSCLANTMRREILLLLRNEGSLRFMDITRRLEVEDHTKVNFHLRVLREARLLQQDEKKNYLLSAEGKKITDCMTMMFGKSRN